VAEQSISPEYVVIELIVTCIRHQATHSNRQREKDLTGSVYPDLQK